MHAMHWRRKWQPTPVFLPGESQGQRSLVGCRLWGHTELGTTEVTYHIIHKMDEQVLLHSTGICIQYPIINYNGKEYEKVYIYIKESLFNNSIVNQLYFNKMFFSKKEVVSHGSF